MTGPKLNDNSCLGEDGPQHARQLPEFGRFVLQDTQSTDRGMVHLRALPQTADSPVRDLSI